MHTDGLIESPAILLPLAADEVARLVPLAARELGWRLSELQLMDKGRWRGEIGGAGDHPSGASVLVERRSAFWTAVRLCWEHDRAVPEQERQLFVRALVRRSQAPELPE